MSKLELEVAIIRDTLAKLKHIAAYSSQLEVLVTPYCKELFRCQPTVHPKLAVQMLDIL